MARKTVLGAIIGAVIVFIVSALWHMTPGLNEIGMRGVPNEDAVQAALRTAISEPGFYIYPGPNMKPGRTKEQKDADNASYQAKFRQGPRGILIFSPGGTDFNFPRALVNQFVFILAGALILAWILSAGAAGSTYGTRILIVLLTSIFAGIVILLPYWNWYGFPLSYVLGDIVGWAVSWFVGGLAMAKIVKP
jgi:hypothetical protein